MKTFEKTFIKRKPKCRLWRNQRGATAVEFALVAPIFLIMAFGVVEMARAMFIKSALQFAVEETSRYALVNTSVSTTTLSTYANTSLSNSGANITGASFSVVQETTGSRTFMSITGTYNFTVLVPLVPIPDVTLSAKSRVPVG
jgi:Flp pilus assembly protein TadG